MADGSERIERLTVEFAGIDSTLSKAADRAVRKVNDTVKSLEQGSKQISRAQTAMAAEGVRITRSMMTVTEQYADTLKALNVHLKAETISQETFNRAQLQAALKLPAATAALRANREEHARLSKEMAFAATVREAVMSSTERYERRVDKLKYALIKGRIEQKEYNAAVTQLYLQTPQAIAAYEASAKAVADAAKINQRARGEIGQYRTAVAQLNTLLAEGLIGHEAYNRVLTEEKNKLSYVRAAQAAENAEAAKVASIKAAAVSETDNYRRAITQLNSLLAKGAILEHEHAHAVEQERQKLTSVQVAQAAEAKEIAFANQVKEQARRSTDNYAHAEQRLHAALVAGRITPKEYKSATNAARAQTPASLDVQRRWNAANAEATAITRANRNELDRAAAAVTRLTYLRNADLISVETYNRALAAERAQLSYNVAATERLAAARARAAEITAAVASRSELYRQRLTELNALHAAGHLGAVAHSRAMRQLSGELGLLETVSNRAIAGLATTQRILYRVGTAAGVTGRRLGMYVTAPLAIMGGLSVKAFGTFDKAMVDSLAITKGVTPEIRAEMEGVVKAIAKSSPTPINELAKSFYFLASAGYDAKQSMMLLPVIDNFARASMMDAAKATEILTTAQSALGKRMADPIENMKQMKEVSDALTKAADDTQATIEELSKSLVTNAGTAIKRLNIDFLDGIALLEAYAQKGVKGEKAGEHLAIVIRDLQGAFSRQPIAWKEMFGLDVYEKMTRNFKSPIKILREMEDRFKGLNPEARHAALHMLGFQERSLMATQTLMTGIKEAEGFRQKLSDIGDETKRVADEKLSAFSNQMAIFKNRVMLAAIEIGEMLAPAVIKLSEKIGEGLQWWAQLDMATKKTYIGYALIAAAIGPVLILTGNLLQATSGVIAVLGFMATAARNARRAILLYAGAEAVATWRTTLLVAAIAAVTAGLVYAASRFEWVQNKWSSFVDWMSGGVKSIMASIGGGIGEALLPDGQADGAAEYLAKVMEGLAGVKEEAQAATDTVNQGYTEMDMKVRELSESLARQIETFHEVSAMNKIMKLEQHGASPEQVAALKAQAIELQQLTDRKNLQEKANRIMEKMVSPQEKYNRRLREANILYHAGEISIEAFRHEAKEAKEELQHELKIKLSITGFEAVEAGTAEAYRRLYAFRTRSNNLLKFSMPEGPLAKSAQPRIQGLAAEGAMPPVKGMLPLPAVQPGVVPPRMPPAAPMPGRTTVSVPGASTAPTNGFSNPAGPTIVPAMRIPGLHNMPGIGSTPSAPVSRAAAAARSTGRPDIPVPQTDYVPTRKTATHKMIAAMGLGFLNPQFTSPSTHVNDTVEAGMSWAKAHRQAGGFAHGMSNMPPDTRRFMDTVMPVSGARADAMMMNVPSASGFGRANPERRLPITAGAVPNLTGGRLPLSPEFRHGDQNMPGYFPPTRAVVDRHYMSSSWVAGGEYQNTKKGVGFPETITRRGGTLVPPWNPANGGVSDTEIADKFAMMRAHASTLPTATESTGVKPGLGLLDGKTQQERFRDRAKRLIPKNRSQQSIIDAQAAVTEAASRAPASDGGAEVRDRVAKLRGQQGFAALATNDRIAEIKKQQTAQRAESKLQDTVGVMAPEETTEMVDILKTIAENTKAKNQPTVTLSAANLGN